MGIGRVEARRIHQLSSVVAARLVSVSADTGDRVQAGQQVGQLDPVDLPERLRAAQAAEARWRESRAKLAYVRSNAARFERLAGQGAVSDDATLGALAAQQQSLRLVAPVAGIVSRRLVDPGSTVVPGQPVLEIADPGQFWIDVRFAQRQAAGLALGQLVTVEFRRLQGHQLAGVIERIETTADSLTEELNAKVRLQPGAFTGAGFPPLLGELAEVRVALPASRDALAIPAQSLRRRGTELGVWQVGRNGLVFAPLQLGRQDGSGQVEVLADPAALRRYRLQEAKP